MAEFELPSHVVSERRDGRKEVLLHRAMAVISPEKVEIKAARSTYVLPIIGLLLVAAGGVWLGESGGRMPFWLMVVILMASLFIAPASVMGLVGSIAGASVVVDQRKGSLTMQQGYLGMGIGTKELVPFHKFDYMEVTLEGHQPDRWKGSTDSIRQFAIVLVKKSGKRLVLANVPVSEGNQTDGVDRALAVANAIAAIAGSTVKLPEGWELVEIETETGKVVEKQPQTAPRRKGGKHARRN
jgi:hypothetical protein